jgi:hypothetical protein
MSGFHLLLCRELSQFRISFGKRHLENHYISVIRNLWPCLYNKQAISQEAKLQTGVHSFLRKERYFYIT